jgi:DNA-nicking Smr family endonuclease
MKARFQQLVDLAALRDSLHADATAREQRARAATRQAIETQHEVDLFREMVGAVEPLKVPTRVQHPRDKPPPIAHRHRADEAAALAESISDGDPDAVLETDEQLSWRREGVGHDTVKKLRRGHWVVQSEIDLHGWRVDGARDLVSEFLRDSIKRHHRCVRIVHGKGHGSIGKQPVLKGRVKRWLMQKEEVLAFCQAREHDGGGGALIVLLRPST